MSKRKSLGKRTRFEVFKRDGFKCQYCGRSAPDVVLRVDHIEPVAAGGPDDILNFITACHDCNAGKGAVPLSDSSAVVKAREQAQLLEERRQQIEMMMEWRRGLLASQDTEVEEASAFFSSIAVGFYLNERGKAGLRTLVKKFGLRDVLDAIEVSRQYLRFDDDGKIIGESVEESISRLGGICHTQREAREFPEIETLYKIRARLKYRLGDAENYQRHLALEALKNGYRLGLSVTQLRDYANTAYSWRSFINDVNLAADRLAEDGG